jgi:hypothetical protein
LVTAGLLRQVVGIAEDVTRANTPDTWSAILPGLGEWVETGRGQRRFESFRDAPRILLTLLGDVVVGSWGFTPSDTENGEESSPPRTHSQKQLRPPPKVGPIVDVLPAACALTGRDDIGDLDTACTALGVEQTKRCRDEIGALRTETLTIARLHRAELAIAHEMGLGLDLSNLVSTGGIATAVSREAGIR